MMDTLPVELTGRHQKRRHYVVAEVELESTDELWGLAFRGSSNTGMPYVGRHVKGQHEGAYELGRVREGVGY
jgi:hypothetical protein